MKKTCQIFILSMFLFFSSFPVTQAIAQEDTKTNSDPEKVKAECDAICKDFDVLLNPHKVTEEMTNKVNKLINDFANPDIDIRDKATAEIYKIKDDIDYLLYEEKKAFENREHQNHEQGSRVRDAINYRVKSKFKSFLQQATTMISHKDKRVMDYMILFLSHDIYEIRSFAYEELQILSDQEFKLSLKDSDIGKQDDAIQKWKNWWQENKENFKFNTLTTPYMLLSYYKTRTLKLYTIKGELLWERKVKDQFYGASLMPNGNYVVNHNNKRTIVEYDLKTGKVVRSLKLSSYTNKFSVMRNGHIMCMTSRKLCIYDKQGEEVWSFSKNNLRFNHASVLRNGHILYTSGNNVVVIDKDKKEIMKFHTDTTHYIQHAEILPNKNILVTDYRYRGVKEYNSQGKVMWQAKVLSGTPTSVKRLRNGNTIVTFYRKGIVIDKNGKTIKTLFDDNSAQYIYTKFVNLNSTTVSKLIAHQDKAKK